MKKRCNGCGCLVEGATCDICASAADFDEDDDEPLAFAPHPKPVQRERIDWLQFWKLWLLFMAGAAFGFLWTLVIMPKH